MPWTLPLELDPSAAPLALRALVGAVGALSLGFGQRLYKPLVFGTAFAIGALIVWGIAAWLPMVPPGPPVWIASAIGGVALAGAAAAAHRVALVAVGAVCGAVLGGALAGAFALAPWVPLAGAALGAIAAPLLFPVVVKIASALVGAVLVAWAAGFAEHGLALAALWALGAVVQLADRRAPPPDRRRAGRGGRDRERA